ncbi:MAG: hypothetical protein M3Y72_20950 [Acidobacteriota bacterium]|nr:hypothetical protein [Acidobacteriota bacterium]
MRSNFGPFIVDYWREHFPGLVRELEQRGNLEKHADSVADKAAEDFARGMQNGLTGC